MTSDLDLSKISLRILDILYDNHITNYSEVSDCLVSTFAALINKDRKLLWDQKNELFIQMMDKIRICARSIQREY